MVHFWSIYIYKQMYSDDIIIDSFTTMMTTMLMTSMMTMRMMMTLMMMMTGNSMTTITHWF